MSQAIASIRSSLATTVTSGANSAASLTLVAVPGQSHHVTSLDVSVSASVTNLAITLTEGGATRHEWRLTGTNALTKEFSSPLRFAPNTQVVLNIAAGGAGVVTVSNLAFYTQ